MTRLLLAAAGLMLAGTVGFAQQQVREFTSPKLPTRDVLDRMNLKMAWNVRLRTDGRRDGFLSVQVIPGPLPSKDHPQILVQTYYGSVILLDGETGDILWRTDTGDQPYAPGQPAAAYISHSVMVVRKDYLYVLSRVNGLHRVYVHEKGSKLPLLGFQMHSVPSAGILASEYTDITDYDRVYVPMENKLVAYRLPRFGLVDMVKEEGLDFEAQERIRRFLMPDLDWSMLLTGMSFQHRPVLGASRVALAASNGTFVSFNKFTGELSADYKFSRPVAARMAHRLDMTYIPCEDATLYAMNINGALVWRYLSGSPILRKPEATDRDVFVTPERMGLVCLNRDTGRERWVNKALERFLATNFKFVYAADRHGQLHVLDATRGTELAKYDTSGFNIPISNDLNDRLYFASHDGQIMCLHHKDHRQPVRTKQVYDPPKRDEKKKKDPDKKPPAKAELRVPLRVLDARTELRLSALPATERRPEPKIEAWHAAASRGGRG